MAAGQATLSVRQPGTETVPAERSRRDRVTSHGGGGVLFSSSDEAGCSFSDPSRASVPLQSASTSSSLTVMPQCRRPFSHRIASLRTSVPGFTISQSPPISTTWPIYRTVPSTQLATNDFRFQRRLTQRHNVQTRASTTPTFPYSQTSFSSSATTALGARTAGSREQQLFNLHQAANQQGTVHLLAAFRGAGFPTWTSISDV